MRAILTALATLVSVNTLASTVVCYDREADQTYAISVSMKDSSFAAGRYDQNKKLTVIRTGKFIDNGEYYSNLAGDELFQLEKHPSEYFLLQAKDKGVYAMGECKAVIL